MMFVALLTLGLLGQYHGFNQINALPSRREVSGGIRIQKNPLPIDSLVAPIEWFVPGPGSKQSNQPVIMA